ncbi:PQQ-binding-like beta-propeller repeat protein [Nocardia sp. NPDC058705]|uniref:outer membrane protein assembly factor BamB family protein n=1 Tax=Nocardia sp. NPDC058705 TaxID=3346609 RepID=UPI003698A219
MNTSLPRLPDYSAAIVAAAILGTTVLVGGVGLGSYSLFFAAHNPFEPNISSYDPIAEQLGVFANAFGVVVLLVLAVAMRWSVSLRAMGAGNPPVVIMAAVVTVEILISADREIPSTVDRIFGYYVAYPQLPTAVVAWYLIVLGSVLVLAVSFAPPSHRVLPIRAGATSAAVGMLVCAAATGFALRAGDDTRFIDHSTAIRTPTASTPDRLGVERFRVDLIDSRWVVVGGNGFIVGSREGLTAYDGATGTPRWHYLRPKAADHGVRHNPDYMQSIPSENVVVTYWNNLGWMAFDASTGETLWTDSEFARDAGQQDRFRTTNDPLPSLLIRETGHTFVRYEARTGRRMWSPSDETSCRDAAPRIAVTVRAIYQVSMCGGSLAEESRVIAFDPATGETISRRDIPHPANRPAVLSVVDEIVSIDWTSAPFDHLHFASPEALPTAPISGPFTVIAADPPTGTIVGKPDTGPVTLTDAKDPSRSHLVNLSPREITASEVLLTADALISVQADKLQTWQRTDLVDNTPDRALESCSPHRVTAAPGATLIFCEGPRSTPRIIGFAP